MKNSTNDIPLHHISDFAPMGVSAHLYGGEFDDNWNDIEEFPVHRDDHYFFLIVEEGSGYLDIDFQRIIIKQRELYAVAPGQLHGNIYARCCKGWVVLVAQEFIKKQYREIIDRNMFRVRPHAVTDFEFSNLKDVLSLLERNIQSFNKISNAPLIQNITETFVMLASEALGSTYESDSNIDSSKYHLALKFKELIREHYRIEKSVQFYAEKLCITSGYLNEVLKAVTGRSTTYWLQNEILLEAKRLLVATNMSVNEISYNIGYENYSYFNRMFHSKVGMTPMQFRRAYLK